MSGTIAIRGVPGLVGGPIGDAGGERRMRQLGGDRLQRLISARTAAGVAPRPGEHHGEG